MSLCVVAVADVGPGVDVSAGTGVLCVFIFIFNSTKGLWEGESVSV